MQMWLVGSPLSTLRSNAVGCQIIFIADCTQMIGRLRRPPRYFACRRSAGRERSKIASLTESILGMPTALGLIWQRCAIYRRGWSPEKMGHGFVPGFL